MSQTTKCLYCKREFASVGRVFCGESCRQRYSVMKKAEKAASEGRFCQQCKVPIINGNKTYCSQVCQKLATQKRRCCPVCMRQYVGNRKTCSRKCTNALLQKRRDAIKVRQWAEKRRNQPSLEVAPTISHMFRRSLTAKASHPVIIKCFVSEALDFPVDPDVFAILWRDESNVYCHAKKIRTAISILEELTSREIEVLTDTRVLRKYRNA